MITKEELKEAIKEVVREEILKKEVQDMLERTRGKDRGLGAEYVKALVNEVIHEEIRDIADLIYKEEKHAR